LRILGSGKQNTIDILKDCDEIGIAARICKDLIQDGYSDWYLPSVDEFSKLYLNRDKIGGLNYPYYWTSTEYGSKWALTWHSFDGYNGYGDKFAGFAVRAIRYF